MSAPEQKRIFLTAEWRNILMLNYAVDRSLLERFVPSGTELDFFEGQTYMSLIGFEFNRSRVLGFPVPFHQQFIEVNLRFYVKRSSRKGVVFIRELVPKRAVATVARFAFGENYSCVPMSHRIATGSAEYTWHSKDNDCTMKLETEGESFLPAEGTASQFITEHYYGYAAQPDGTCLEYEVQHPRWHVYNGKNSSFSGDATAVYGAEIARVLTHEPDSAFFVPGSAVTVFKGVRIDR